MIDAIDPIEDAESAELKPTPSLRVSWWLLGILSLLTTVVFAMGLSFLLIIDGAFAAGKVFDEKARDERLAQLRREKIAVEEHDGPDQEFHVHLMTAAAERVDYRAFRDLSLWRSLRLSTCLRLAGLLVVIIATFAIFARRERARWWLLTACLLQTGLSAFEAYEIHRELPRFSEAFVRDWHLAYEEVQKEVPYRATLALREGIEESAARSVAWIWFLVASLFWQVLALCCGRSLTRPAQSRTLRPASIAERDDPESSE